MMIVMTEFSAIFLFWSMTMFTFKCEFYPPDYLYGVIQLIPNHLFKRFLKFTLPPQPHLFRWGDAYDD